MVHIQDFQQCGHPHAISHMYLSKVQSFPEASAVTIQPVLLGTQNSCQKIAESRLLEVFHE